MRQDLTFSKNFTDYLGAFWSSIFDQGALGGAVGGSSSDQLIQAYIDLVEMINVCAVKSTPVFHRENLYPVRILKSQLLAGAEVPVYGGGGYFGLQPEESIYQEGSTLLYGEEARRENSYYIKIDDQSLRSLGSVGLNRLFEPSVVLISDSDFSFRDGTLYLRENPFDNALFPKRIVDQDDQQDEEIVLWFADVDTEKFELYRQFGFTFTNYKNSSKLYRDIIEYVFRLVSTGSGLAQIESFLAAITGSPVTKEVVEVVEQVKSTPEGNLVVTDSNVYTIHPDDALRPNIVAGAELPAGTPLTSTVEIVDTNNPEWWKGFESIPLTRNAMSDDVGFISFPNQYGQVQYGPELIKNDLSSPRVRFSLIGQDKDIETFWNGVDQRSKDQGKFVGRQLFLKYGVYEEEDDYFDYPAFNVNPAQIIASDLAPGAILPIRIDLSSVRDSDAFFGTISVLKRCTPVHLMIYLFISTSIVETFDFNLSGDGAIVQSSVEPVDLLDLLNKTFTGDIQDAWEETNSDGQYMCQTPEAVAFSISPGNLLEQFDLSDEDNVVDNVHLKQRKKCSI